ncbi:MAG: efflux RND transporter periplasmic adaptor subunit [Pirellulales bacterium]|nr:efflux RND transporter periplasmic adaptor subunit [Pirellulales bacterium]
MRLKSTVTGVLKTFVPLAAGLIFLVCLVAVIAWMAGVFEKKIQPEEMEVTLRKLTSEEENHIDQVHEVTKDYYEEALGTLKAASRTDIASRILAPINKILVTSGKLVQAGDVLVELDRRALETQRSQAQAALVGAQAALTQAENDYRRAAQAFEKRAVSAEVMDQATANLQVARANLNHAQQALAESDVLISYTTINAPKAGMIVERLAEEGDMAQPGVPLLVLYDPASLRLEVPVMENLAVKLKVGDTLAVRIDALQRNVEATVDEIVPQAEVASRSFLVKVALPRSEGMFEGMAGRLLIPAGTRRHLCLATDAIDTIGQLQFVEVVDLEQHTKQRRMITTGRLGMPGRVEVLSGLKAGENVLVDPPPENQSLGPSAEDPPVAPSVDEAPAGPPMESDAVGEPIGQKGA